MPEPMLKVENLHVHYGNIHALKGLSIEVEEGEIVSLIGANGAGNTTLLTKIMNQVPTTEVVVRFLGYVIETGEVVLADDADKLLSNTQVKEAYLGG